MLFFFCSRYLLHIIGSSKLYVIFVLSVLDRPDLLSESQVGLPHMERLAPAYDMRLYRDEGHFDCNDHYKAGNVMLTETHVDWATQNNHGEYCSSVL